MVRVKEVEDEAAGHGWIEVFTPTGGTVFVVVNSAAHELCDDWLWLRKGRSGISPPEFEDYVASGTAYTHIPRGMLVELLWLCSLREQAVELIHTDATVRDYLIRLWRYTPAQNRRHTPELAELSHMAHAWASYHAAMEVLRDC